MTCLLRLSARNSALSVHVRRGRKPGWARQTASRALPSEQMRNALTNGLSNFVWSLRAVCVAVLLLVRPLCNRANQAQSICFKIQCDQYLQTAAKDATGERAAGLQALASTLTGQGITVSNIVDYMSLIEQRSIQVRYICTFPFLVRRSAGRLPIGQNRVLSTLGCCSCKK